MTRGEHRRPARRARSAAPSTSTSRRRRTAGSTAISRPSRWRARPATAGSQVRRSAGREYVHPDRAVRACTDAHRRRGATDGWPPSRASSLPGLRAPRVAHEVGGAADRRRDVAVGRVQQRPADHEPADRRLASARSHDANVASGSGPGAPPRISSGCVVIAATVSMSAVAWIFSHVYADEPPSAAHTPTAFSSASGSSSHTALPDGVLGVRDRLDHRQHAPRSLSSPTARAHAARVGTVPGSRVVDAQQHLAGVEVGGHEVVGVVRGEPVVQLPARAGQPAAVHRADRDPARRARRAATRSSMMSALASTPSTRGLSRAVSSRSSIDRRSTIACGSPPTPIMPRAVWSAATMNSDAVVRERSPARPLPPSASAIRPGSSHADVDQVLVLPSSVEPRSSTARSAPASSRISASVGMASAHSSRPATIAPAALAYSTSSLRPTSRRAARGRARRRTRRRRRGRTPPRPGAAARPRPPSRVATSTPVAAELDDRQLDAAIEQPVARPRRARRCRRRPRHSVRLPTATVACVDRRRRSPSSLVARSAHSAAR